MVDNGNVIDHCPARIYYVDITHQIKDETEPMMLGNLFEHKALSMPGRAPSVPRDMRTKKPKVATERLLMQAEIFKEDCKLRQIQVIPGMNTQVEIVKRWEKDPKVILKGKLDLFPTTFLNDDGELELCIIDLKSTGNVYSTFSKFGWGNPESLDHLQAIMYHYLVQDIDFDLNDKYLPDNYLRDLFSEEVMSAIKDNAYAFRYMIYDYSPSMNKRIYNPEITAERYRTMHESIRKTVSYVRDYNQQGWPMTPNNSCKDCPVLQCTKRKLEFKV